MKKILILSYYFPPCNLTAAERVHSYALYLKEMGYHPVIVTRNWDIPVIQAQDEHRATGEKIKHEKNTDYEVYYLPFKPNLQGKLFVKYFGTQFYFLYLITAFVYGILENFTSYFTTYRSFYSFSEKLIKEDKNISLVLASGSPFHLFKYGYKLNKKFNIPWVADYRDDWNTNELFADNWMKKLVQKISMHKERKWVNSAGFYISISDFYVKKISSVVSIPGHTIINGYLEKNYKGLEKNPSDDFCIVYVGSLLKGHPIEIFINAYKKFVDDFPAVRSGVVFVGLSVQPVALARIKNLIKGYEDHFQFTERVAKNEAIKIQYSASVLLSCNYNNLKGVPGSKLYEYIALRKPVLVCPSDGDMIESTLTETGQGYYANTETACYEKLKELFAEYGYEHTEAKHINVVAVEKYSRYNNVEKLANLLDSIFINTKYKE